MARIVRFTPEAQDQLDKIEAFIAEAGAPDTAARYVDSIVDFCGKLANFPLRGVPRDDLYAGLRVTHYRGRAIIAYTVDADTVSIIGVFYGGRNIEAAFGDSNDDF